MSEINKKQMPSLDIMKYIMAILIMLAHICSENVKVHPVLKTFTSLYNFGVPFFFACSGFLFFLKLKNIEEQKQYRAEYIKFSKRILIMYLVWSIIYFCFVFVSWLQNGTSSDEVLHYFHKALVVSPYQTIWFLPALWIGVSVAFYLLYYCKLSIKSILSIAVIMYIIGSFGYSYSPFSNKLPLLEKIYDVYNQIFITTRNGLFAGFPFVVLGLYLAFINIKIKPSYNFFLTILFCGLYIGESIFIKYKIHTNNDMGLLLIPAIYFLMSWLLTIEIKPRKIYQTLRNQSMLIFLGQRLFITAIPSILPASFMAAITKNPYIGLFIFVGTSICFSVIIEKLSKKYKFLKILW